MKEISEKSENVVTELQFVATGQTGAAGLNAQPPATAVFKPDPENVTVSTGKAKLFQKWKNMNAALTHHNSKTKDVTNKSAKLLN